MKLHLPKQLFTALITAITLAAAPAALTLGSAAWGEDSATTTWAGTGYEWKGGTGDIFAGKTDAEAAAIWKDSANWTAVRCEYNTADGNGPGTASSNMWNTIKIDGGETGVSFGSEDSRLITLEGWNPSIELSNGAKLYVNMFKWQTNATVSTSVTEGSVLDIDFQGGQFTGTHSGNLTIGADSSIVFRMQNTSSTASFTINMNASTATMKFIGDNAITHTGAITVNSTYIADAIANAAESVGTINLGLYADNVDLTKLTFNLGLSADTWVDLNTHPSNLNLSSSFYTIGQGDDGQYYVSYHRRKEGYTPLTYSKGGTLTWTASTKFDNDRTFETSDYVEFQNKDADVTLGADVDIAALVIDENISVNLTGAGYTLSTYLVDLKGTLELEDNVIGGALNFTGDSTGTLILNNSATANLADLASGVSIILNDSATANLANLASGGSITLNDNATANLTSLASGGSIILNDNATANLTSLASEGSISSASATAQVVLPTGYTRIINQFSDYAGVLLVSNGAVVYIGGDKDANDGGTSDFQAGRVVIESGGAVHTHTAQETITSDWDLRSGATLGNKDKNKKLSGNIRFNIQEDGTYNANGTVTLMQHWCKNWEFSGQLSGQGNVELLSASLENGNAVYKLSGGSNDFSGAYILKDGQHANSERKVILELANANAAKDATIKLNSTNSIAILQLDQDSTIASITSSDIDNTIKSNNSTARTLNVTGGSAGFVGTIDSTITLNLTGGTFTVNGNITNNGKIQVATDATLNFSTAGNQTLGGTVELNGGKINSGNGSSDNRVKTIESLTMLGTGEIVGSNWNVIWNIGALNGSGNLTWKNVGTHWAPSVLNINGGTYTGTLTADRTAGKAGDRGGYQSVLQINSGAASTFTEGVVHLDGKGTGAYMQMALNADQVEFGGLTSSNQFAYIFAGEATLEGGASANLCMDKAASTRTSVMSFNSKADTEYDFKGSVGSGISITKSGTGAQIFSGDTSDFDGTVTINAGTLGFTGTGDLGSGAITIASGAELKLGNSSADAERTLANSISGAGKMTITGANTVKLTSAATHSGGTEVQAGSMLSLTTGGQTGALRGTVDVYGTLKFSAGDVTGWGNSADVISTINVHSGGEVNVAVTNNQTAAGLVLNLQGGSLTGVSGSNLDLYYGGGNKYATINALAADGATAESPTVSTISGVSLGIRQNDNIFTVDSNARLEINSSIVDRIVDGGKGNHSPAGTPSLAKDGAGEMVLKGTNNFDWFTYVNAGTLTLEGSATLGSNEIHVAQGATFKISTGTSEAPATTTLDAVKNAGKLLHEAYAETTLTTYTATGAGSSIEVAGGTLNIGTLNGGAALEVSADALLNITNWNNIATTQVISGSTEDISIGNISIDFVNFALTSAGETELSRTLDKNDTSQNSTNGFLVTKGKYYLFEGIGLADKEVTGFGVTQAEQVDGKWYTTVTNQTGSVSDAFAVVESATYASAGILGDVEAQIAAEQTLTLDIAEAQTLNAALTGEGAFVKSGDGKLTLGNTISNSGGVTISAGEMVVDSSSKLNISSVVVAENAILTYTSVGSSETAKVSGDGTLKLETGNRIEGIKDIVNGSIGKLLLAGEGTVYEITSSTDQPDYLHKTQQIEVADGATLGDRLTSNTLGSSSISLTIAGDGSGTAGEADAAALALGRSCNGGGDVKIGYNVSLADDATIWVAEKGNNNTAITGYLNEQLIGAGHTMTKTGAGELVLEKGADNASLHVAAGSLKLRGTTTSEEVTVANGTSLKLDAAATITGKDSSDATMTKVQMSSAGISGTADGASVSNADVQIAQLAQDASFTIQDMTLTNTTITAATTETRVNLNNVSGDATLAKGKFHMQGQLPVALVTPGGSAVEFSSSALSGLTLNTADSSASLVVDLGDLSCLTPMGPGQYDLTITLSGFTMEDYSGLATGAGLVFAADSWLGSLLNQAHNANVQMTIAQAEAGAAAAAEGGSASGVSYSTGNVGTIITITGLNVPEPTTATLSLLALAALAARRRRND